MVRSLTTPHLRRVPAEWEPQRAVWIAWPHNPETWPGHFDSIPASFCRLIDAIAPAVPVHVIGRPELRQQLAKHCGTPGKLQEDWLQENVRWFEIATNDSWIRDYGPTFVLDGSASGLAIDWRYNAWGGKYPPWDADDAATAQIISHALWQRIPGGLCLEGGALEWDGCGRLLTTTNCLVTDTRNPGRSKSEIEAQLQRLTGVREILWVDGGGLIGDDTDGHIDQLARFIDPQTVVVAVSRDANDPNHDGLQSNARLLSEWAAETSPAVTVHPLPIPPPRFIDGHRVPESYCNFLRLGPDRLLVPTFGCPPSDDLAIGRLTDLTQQQSPHIEVIGVDCQDLIWGLGALHCASCNEPAR